MKKIIFLSLELFIKIYDLFMVQKMQRKNSHSTSIFTVYIHAIVSDG